MKSSKVVNITAIVPILEVSARIQSRHNNCRASLHQTRGPRPDVPADSAGEELTTQAHQLRDCLAVSMISNISNISIYSLSNELSLRSQAI